MLMKQNTIQKKEKTLSVFVPHGAFKAIIQEYVTAIMSDIEVTQLKSQVICASILLCYVLHLNF